MPTLRTLIQNSPTLDENEKKMWTDLLPNLNPVQTIKLFDIFENERLKLEEIEKSTRVILKS